MNQGPYGPTPPPLGQGGPPQGGPLQPSGYGPPPGGGYGPPPADDQMAWISIALSSLGWMSCCCTPIPFVGFIGLGGGLLLSIGGIITGWMALQKAKQQSTRTDLAMIGLLLGAVRLGLFTLFFVVIMILVVAGVGVGFLEGLTHPH